MQNYEQIYGIYDHAGDTDPNSLKLFAMHESESTINCSIYMDRMRSFIKNRVHQLIGMNWTEFIKLPSWQCREIMKLAEEMQQQLSSEESRVKNVLNDIESNH